MLTDPVIIDRKKQAYAAIRAKVAMNDISHLLPPLIPEVADWLTKNKVAADGPPFFRYLTMGNELDVEVGIPVKDPIMGDARVIPGFFPDGKYVCFTYTGDYIHIKKAHMSLNDWSIAKGYKATPGTVTEIYITDPKKEPDPNKWKTEIIYKLA